MKKCYRLCFFLLVTSVWTFGQTADQAALFDLAASAYQNNQFAEAIQLGEKLRGQYEAQDSFAIEVDFLLAKSYAILGKEEQILPLVKRMESITQSAPHRAELIEVWLAYLKGLCFSSARNRKQSITSFELALSKTPTEDAKYGDGIIPLIHNNLGYQLMEDNQPEAALMHLEKAYELWKINPGINAKGNMVTILSNIARVYRDLFQSDRAMRYSLEAMRKAKQFFSESSLEWIEAAANHALLLEQLNDLSGAELTYQSIASYLDQVDVQTKTTILSNWGLLYRQSGDFEKALEKIKAAATIEKNLPFGEDPKYIGTLINIAGLYFKTGRFGEVLPILYEADSLANLYGSTHHPTLIGAIGLTFSQLDRPKEALDYIQSALASATRTEELFLLSGLPNPPLDRFVVAANSPHLDYLRFKTMALWNTYAMEPQIEYLQVAFDTYALLHDLLQKTFVYADIWQDNKLQTTLEFAMVGLLKASYALQEAGEDGRLEEVYTYLQQSKAISIRNNLQTNLMSVGVASARLDSLRKAVIYTEQALFLAQRNPGGVSVDSLEQKVLVLYDELEAVEMDLSAGFFEVPSLLAIQNAVDKAELFLETYLAPNGIYTISISNNDISLFFGESREDIDSTIIKVRRSLSDWNYVTTHPQKTKAELAKAGAYLYQILMAEVIGQYPETEKLVVAPNGILAALPYEILLDEQEGLVEKHYSNWPFMVRNYTISYANSACVWLYQKEKKARHNWKYMAAFSPIYELDDDFSGDDAIDALRQSQTWNLPFAREEAEAVCEMVDGDLYKGPSATKAVFWEKANQYRILHLAMHAISEQAEPEFSRLLFTMDTTDSSVLYANELYGQRLDADMVVLSACNTGWGESVQSEGILSLGYAFSSAGVSSTIITLWPVADAAGIRLVSNFYGSIQKGRSKSKALQEAKKIFLANASSDLEGHPYFWAAYQLYGNQSPIPKAGFPWYTWVLIAAVSVFVVVAAWWLLSE